MKLFDRLIPKRNRTSVQVVGEGAVWANTLAYKNATVREAVDAVARHAGKLKPRHMLGSTPVADRIEDVLQLRPNPAMNAYDMLYKMVSTQMLKNNAFAYIHWHGADLIGIYPVDYSSVSAEEDPATGALTMHFTLMSGRDFWADYGNLIHLRRHFAERQILGADNGPMNEAAELVNASNAGTVNAIKNGTTLRGILHVTKKALDPKETKKRRDEFIRDYANPEDASGIAALDADMEYTPLDPSKLYTVKAEERREIKDEVYSYFGVSEKIVRSTYTEDEWNAFYESMLEPIAIQLGLELTQKLFTRRERAEGHNIIVEANRLQYASASTKINLLNTMGMLGIITKDEGREIFNLGKIEGGDELIQNWNQGGQNQGGDGK
jgi:HK97 family phage portal protein